MQASGELSLVGKQCLNRRSGGRSERLTGLCALEQGEPGMRQGLRKSFQSLINWGQRNLRIESVDANNANFDLFSDPTANFTPGRRGASHGRITPGK